MQSLPQTRCSTLQSPHPWVSVDPGTQSPSDSHGPHAQVDVQYWVPQLPHERVVPSSEHSHAELMQSDHEQSVWQ